MVRPIPITQNNSVLYSEVGEVDLSRLYFMVFRLNADHVEFISARNWTVPPPGTSILQLRLDRILTGTLLPLLQHTVHSLVSVLGTSKFLAVNVLHLQSNSTRGSTVFTQRGTYQRFIPLISEVELQNYRPTSWD